MISLFPKTIYRGWGIVFVSWLALLISSGATGYVFNLLVRPMEAELGWERSTLYGVLSVAGLVASLLSGPIGPLLDRYGGRVMMTVGAAMAGTLLALASQVREPWQYYLLLGVGVAVTRPALLNVGPRTAIANWFVQKRPLAFGLYSTGNPVAGVTLIAPMAWVIANFGWRWVWVIMGLMEVFVVAPLSWIFVRRRPEDLGLLPDGATVAKATTNGSEKPLPPVEDLWTRGTALRTKTFWLVVAGSLLVGFPASAIAPHLVPFIEQRGQTSALAATGVSLYAFAALSARPFWAYLVARAGVQRAQTIFTFVYGTAISAFVLASGTIPIIVATTALGFVIGGLGQIQSQVWPDYFGRGIVGTITGLATILTMPASAGGPWLVAVAFDRFGSYDFVISLFAVFAFMSCVFFSLARRPVPPAALVGQAGREV